MHVYYTKYDDKIIKTMLAEGKQLPDIATALGRSEMGVRLRIRLLVRDGKLTPEEGRMSPVRPRRFSDAELRTIKRMLAIGHGFTSIGVKVGRTGQAVKQKVNALRDRGQWDNIKL